MRKRKIDPVHDHVNVHMIFDINMDGKFTRKAKLVAYGQKTAPPSSITYSSVDSMDIVRIAFLLASLNDLDIFACDTGNAYHNDKCGEKLWTESGTEFGTGKRMMMIIPRALYGLKSSGDTWKVKH